MFAIAAPQAMSTLCGGGIVRVEKVVLTLICTSLQALFVGPLRGCRHDLPMPPQTPTLRRFAPQDIFPNISLATAERDTKCSPVMLSVKHAADWLLELHNRYVIGHGTSHTTESHILASVYHTQRLPSSSMLGSHLSVVRNPRKHNRPHVAFLQFAFASPVVPRILPNNDVLGS